MNIISIGIDIAKLTFVAAIKERGRYYTKELANDNVGFKALLNWLNKYPKNSCKICMEATGIYGDRLATFMHKHGFAVYVENPTKIKHFINSQLTRNKTDMYF